MPRSTSFSSQLHGVGESSRPASFRRGHDGPWAESRRGFLAVRRMLVVAGKKKVVVDEADLEVAVVHAFSRWRVQRSGCRRSGCGAAIDVWATRRRRWRGAASIARSGWRLCWTRHGVQHFRVRSGRDRRRMTASVSSQGCGPVLPGRRLRWPGSARPGVRGRSSRASGAGNWCYSWSSLR